MNLRFLSMRWSVAVMAVMSVFAVFAFIPIPKEKEKQYVLLVSLDAFRWDYPQKFNTPNLGKIAAEGIKAEKLIPSFPTNTFPNHYSIATGLYPDHHGIVNNTFFDPVSSKLYRIGDRSAVEDPSFYYGEPVWVTARKQGLKTGSFFWVGSEAPVKGMQPDYWKRYSENITYGERIDTVVKWFSYSENKRPQLVTLYFDEPDATSHDYGPLSAETGAVVSYLDSLIGDLRNKLSLLPHGGKINLIVLSDHGMAEVSSDRYVNLYDAVPKRMISDTWGGNPVVLIQPKEGKSDSVVMLINRTKGVKAWKKENLPARWNYGSSNRIPEVVAVADSSWYLSTRPRASVFKGGAHGYDNLNSDMFAVFYASGPAFRKGIYRGDLYNTDIYNMICRILEIDPAPNDGKIERIKKLLK